MFGGGDRAVLEELYEATGGLDGSWLRDGNWCSSAPLSTWDRVEVDDDDAGTVVELLLYDNGLRGSLPRSLARLKGLRRLHVNGNALRGGVPLPLLRRLAARPPLDLRLWPGNEGMLQCCAPAAAFASPLLPQRPFFLLRVAAAARGEAGAGAVAGAAGCAKPGDGFDAARRAGALVRVVHRMGNGDLVVHAVAPPPEEEEGGCDADAAALVAGSATAGEGGARAWGRPLVVQQARVAFLHAAVGEHGGGRVFSDAAALSAAEEAVARQQLDPALRVLPRGTEYVWAAQCCLPRAAAEQQRQQAEATRLSLAYFVQSCGSFLLALPPPPEGEGALAGEERAAVFLGACGWLRVAALAALSPVRAHGCDYGGDSDDGDGQGGGWRGAACSRRRRPRSGSCWSRCARRWGPSRRMARARARAAHTAGVSCSSPWWGPCSPSRCAVNKFYTHEAHGYKRRWEVYQSLLAAPSCGSIPRRQYESPVSRSDWSIGSGRSPSSLMALRQ